MQNVMDKPAVHGTKPLSIEPVDREWGVGVNSLGDAHSPFPPVNRFRRFVIDSAFTVDHERACL
jgi:hypothetical protein